jgi:iduronate 2-sulfatase
MKHLLLLTVFALCFITNNSAQKKEPNVLIFLVDDLRTDLGCYENNVVKSPNIDALAKEGVLFENAYCQQSVCAPSRMSLLSGLRPETIGIYDIYTPFRPGNEDVVTMPQLFMQNGYKTVSIGKVYHHSQDDIENWSIYFPKEPNAYVKPETIERVLGLKKEANAKGLKGKAYRQYVKGPAFENAEVSDEGYKDGRSAKNAIETLHEIKDEKFFMVVGLSKPHLPFNAPKKYWDLYDKDDFEIPSKDEPKGMYENALTNWGELRAYSNIPKEGNVDDNLSKDLKHGYYACVSYVDAQLGKVMKTLDELDLRKNTIVLLMSDHGWKLGEYSAWCKHTNFELDVNVPLIFSREKGYKERVTNAKTKVPVENTDVFPTLAEICGFEYPKMDGQSIKKLLDNPGLKWTKGAYSIYPRKGVMGCTCTDGAWRYTEWRNNETQETEFAELYKHTDGNRIATENFAGNPDFKEIEERMKQLLEEQFPHNRKSFYSTKVVTKI